MNDIRAIIKQFIRDSDVIISPTGQQCLNSEASQKIAEYYGLDLAPGQIYPVEMAGMLIIQEEQKRANSVQIEESAPVIEEKEEIQAIDPTIREIVEFIKTTDEKSAFYLAQLLNDEFNHIRVSEIMLGLKQANAEGVLSNADDVAVALTNLLKVKAITFQVNKICSSIADEQERLQEVTNLMHNYYNRNVGYSFIRMALSESTISEEEFSYAIDNFYDYIASQIISKSTNLSLEETADLILKDFSAVDMGRTLAILAETDGLAHDINAIAEMLYKKDDEEDIIKLMKKAQKNRLSAQEIVDEILDFNCEYHISFIINTLKDYQARGFVFPYDEIYAILDNLDKEDVIETVNNVYVGDEYIGTLNNLQKEVDSVSEEVSVAFENPPIAEDEQNDSITTDEPETSYQPPSLDELLDLPYGSEDEVIETEFSLEPITESVSTLVPNEIYDVEGITILDAVPEPEDKRKRFKIVDRKKEIGLVERRKKIAFLLTGAGTIATIVLVSAFKISPEVAARNCWASINSFNLGNIGLAQLLPASSQALGIFTSAAATFVGTITYLYNHVKGNKLESEIEEEEIRRM